MKIKNIKMTEESSPTKKSNEPYINLILDGGNEFHKDGYDLFMNANRDKLYKNLFDLFKGLRNTKKKTLTMVVTSKIIEFEWKTVYKYGKKDAKVLLTDIIPYYEKVEDYETCIEVMNLYQELTN